MLQANEDFKNDVRSELDDIRRLLKHQVTTGSTPTFTSAPITSSTTNPVISDSTSVTPDSSSTMISNVPQFNSTSPTNDVQTQMMLMLTETFSKLSTALVDKTSDTKSDWPKFSGDSKKFRAWYLAIMAQISLPPWQELYDPTTNDVVSRTSNATLNGKLYAKLLVSLEGSALQSIVSSKHIRANGLLLLQELTLDLPLNSSLYVVPSVRTFLCAPETEPVCHLGKFSKTKNRIFSAKLTIRICFLHG